MVHAGSRRGKGPWVAVNCANFNEQLLESELFGHEKGAFTGASALKRGLFEIARGGTLFLDEVGEMDVKLQAKLLRVLQERVFRRVGGGADLEADVRVIAASNRNLPERVRDGSFRDDLYHRLSRVVVELPALRERPDDIVPMAIQFADRAFRARGKAFNGFSPEAELDLRSYPWPGNVRELLNIIERTALVWQGGESLVCSKDLGIPVSGAPGTPVARPVQSAGDAETGYTELKKRWGDSFEREFLVNSLTRNSGNVSAAAREAKLDRSNYLRLLRRHALRAQDFRKGQPTLTVVESTPEPKAA
jgi:transcriptional regulator with GAF, ATPase, and Fis domain